MKNIYTERAKRKNYWEKLTIEERFTITKGFTQVFGGEPDKELEEIVFERLVDGEISTDFLDTVLKFSKEGDGNFLMFGEFENKGASNE